jgi:Cft2 family RNA processing exonuclease
LELREARLTCYPAGHILGAAQLLIEFKGERTVYTGDIKLQEPLCGQATQPVACDRLIIESTFGLPIYRFLSREEARDRILFFARESFEEGSIPVFLGYPLGRGQEIANVLCEAGIPTALHGAIARYLGVYEKAGFQFPGALPYDNRATPGRALLVPPEFRRQIEASGRKYRVAYVSGWAALDNARARSGAEELIPYSDHAGFDELLELIRQSGARQVDVIHGYTEPFARILRSQGLEATAPERTTGRASADEVE